MDKNNPNLFERPQPIGTIAGRDKLLRNRVRIRSPDARGMARGPTLLTLRRNGEFRLGVNAEKGVLDVAEAASLLRMYAPATVDDLHQSEDCPSRNALVEVALQSDRPKKAFVDEQSIEYGPVVTRPKRLSAWDSTTGGMPKK